VGALYKLFFAYNFVQTLGHHGLSNSMLDKKIIRTMLKRGLKLDLTNTDYQVNHTIVG
jgi:hypothetical protein